MSKNRTDPKKLSVKDSSHPDHLPDWDGYEKALFSHGTKITGNYVKARISDWLEERKTIEGQKIFKEDGDREAFRTTFNLELKDETCEYVVDTVGEWVLDQGLESYFPPSVVREKVSGKEGKGASKGWWDYWFDIAQKEYKFAKPNAKRMARRNALDKKMVNLHVKDGIDRKQIAQIIGVTPNHVDKVFRRCSTLIENTKRDCYDNLL